MNDSNTNERLMKFLQADPEKQARIDEILNGTFPAERETSVGPLLLGMGAGAKFLGVSRATLWRKPFLPDTRNFSKTSNGAFGLPNPPPSGRSIAS